MNVTPLSKKILKEILPIYEKLISKNHFKNVCTFCVQWGENFPKKENTGILFVGKANNGWITQETDTKLLFSETYENRIFARDDQMKWVNNQYGSKKGYNTKRSAFYRVMKRTSEQIYPQDWYSHIAWSNLFKIAPWKGGNPGIRLRDAQQEHCIEIFQKEIDVLSPKFVIMLTSGWERVFINSMSGNDVHEEKEVVNWSDFQTFLYEIDNVYYIVSPHPQGKDETEHVNAISGLIRKYK